ncbi:MAG: type II toxin-antitoxin system YafQ family toxin [Bacteroidales bacterium]|nr:type II toxin-antitoxin system YafQ family toxin [Bacteroidales bacterium]
MWKLKLSSQFKKDLKRYKNNPEKLVEVRIVLEQLQNRGTVDSKYKPHTLSGSFKGYCECHIENDFLLIWFDKTDNTIVLVRLGAHSELFKR